MTTVYLRCDAGDIDGLGHVMRCLTLAEAFAARRTHPHFVTAEGPGHVGRARAEAAGFPVSAAPGPAGSTSDADALVALLAANPDTKLVVADSKRIEADWLSRCGAAAPIVWITDEDRPNHKSAVVLNGNLTASREVYGPADGDTLLLLGPSYNLIHPAYFESRRTRDSEPLNILITMGGEDPQDHTSLVLRRFAGEWADHSITIVIGPAHPDPAAVRAATAETAPHAQIVPAPPNLMPYVHRADLAITAGGTTCYELAAAGVAQLAIVIEEHQRAIVASLAQAGALKSIGDYHGLRPDAGEVLASMLSAADDREALGLAGRALFPGPGAPRVVDRVLDHLGMETAGP
jgi:UDP-2,4-diacetamido-2,4,6-trideoxy-beta-L-altropyranose hydrolase